MTPDELRATTSLDDPPAYLPVTLAALWWDAKGDWTRAHGMIDDLETPQAMVVHAYLHRKEGDSSNARYWYSRAGRPFYEGSLDAEWQALAEELLAGTHK